MNQVAKEELLTKITSYQTTRSSEEMQRLFAEIIGGAVTLIGKDAIVSKFKVAPSTVDRWANRVTHPLDGVGRRVVRWIGERLKKASV